MACDRYRYVGWMVLVGWSERVIGLWNEKWALPTALSNTSWFVHHWFSLHSYFVSPSSSGVQAAAIAVIVRCFRSAYNNHLDVIVVLDVTKRLLFRLLSPLSVCARVYTFYFFVVCSNILNALERTAENNKISVLFITKEKLGSFGRVSSFCVFGMVFGLAFFCSLPYGFVLCAIWTGFTSRI